LVECCVYTGTAEDGLLAEASRVAGSVKKWAFRNQVISAVAVHCAMQHRFRKIKGET
jgi:hypothetical protein